MSSDVRLKRFNEIREALCEGQGNHASLTAALPTVQEWLNRGDKSAQVALQAAQLLLAEGERRGDAVRAVVKPLRELLPEVDGLDLRLQKCLVLACLQPEVMSQDMWRVLALAASPWWWTTRARDDAWAWIEPLLARANQPEKAQSLPPWSAPPLTAFDKAAVDRRFTEALNSIATSHASAGTLAAPLAEVTTSLLATNAFGLTLAKQLGTSMFAQLRAQAESDSAERALLWRSHARYCFAHARPLRALPGEASKRWWASFELACDVPPSWVEPASSMLVETLVDLGVAFETERPLGDWLAELAELLRTDKKVPDLTPGFAAHVKQCAIGLPVSRLRVDPRAPFDASALAEATTLDLDASIASWEWSSWLLRECMLDRAFG